MPPAVLRPAALPLLHNDGSRSNLHRSIKDIPPLQKLSGRPAISPRTLSSPPMSPTSKMRDPEFNLAASRSAEVLTPPTTPTRPRRRSSSLENLRRKGSMTKPENRHSRTDDLLAENEERFDTREKQSQDLLSPLEYDSEFEILKESSGRPREYGRGVWSVVYKATSQRPIQPSSVLLTPPTSPAAPFARLLAIKFPLRRDAHPILHNEALLLTYLAKVPEYDRHVTPFYGYVSSIHSLVLAAIPQSLSSHITTCSANTRATFSTRTMFNPVLGSTRAWLVLAQRLIDGLDWLHEEAETVHGDIKPQNILLRPRQSVDLDRDDHFPYDPLFADFSSSHHLTKPLPAMPLSAITPSYTAPELLSALKSPGTVLPTKAGDVFSLAVTLLAAATGDLLVYPGASEMQRLAMAREGHHVLDFVRSGPNGSRVPRNGPVQTVVERAVLKEGVGRISAEMWMDVVQGVVMGEPEKKGRL